MKTTPLTEVHIGLGAKMAEFAGYNMPISYSTISDEHEQVRASVGIFDVSHMGEFILKGKDATALIQQVTSNDVSKLQPGDAQYSCLPNKEGGIVDDLLVYRLFEDACAEGEQAYMLVVNASNILKDWKWIKEHNTYDVRMHDISMFTGLLALQGPDAIKVLEKLTTIDLAEMKYYTFNKGVVAGEENILVSATGYTGSGGFEIYARNSQLVTIWNAIMEAGKEFNIQPIGLGARDTLRLEMGYCLYGNDIDDTTSPIEAGLGWITKTKKENFNSIETFRAQRKEGVSQKLVGFKMEDRRVPRHDYIIEDVDGNEIGKVTSGTQSPTLDIPIGMGYVHVDFAKVGTAIKIVAGKKRLDATITKMPFVKIS